MVNDILAGILLGACITMAIMFLLTFIAKRKCWVEIKVAPSDSASVGPALDRALLNKAFDQIEEMDARLNGYTRRFDAMETSHTDLCAKLEPYLKKKE